MRNAVKDEEMVSNALVEVRTVRSVDVGSRARIGLGYIVVSSTRHIYSYYETAALPCI